MMQLAHTRSGWLPWWGVCGRSIGCAARAVLVGALFLAPVFAAEKEASGPGDPAIPPGQDELVAAMLGQGDTLPDGCSLTGGGADHTVVKATYTCPGGEVVFELAHPGQSPAPTAQTENFAITLQSGSPPDSLAPALASLIRSREADFEWTWPAAENEALEDDVADEDGGDED